MTQDNTPTFDFIVDLAIENPVVTHALELIKAEGLDSMRCVLTGAPYATISHAEIKMTLDSIAGIDSDYDADMLLDKWNLNLFTLCSKPGPLFINRQELALSELAHGNTPESHARLLTYYLSKLFYATGLQKRTFNSDRMIDRMHFTRQWHDFLVGNTVDSLRKLTFRLAACDGWLSFTQWKELNFFKAFNNKALLNSTQYAYFRSALALPMDMEVSLASLAQLIDSLESIVATSEVNGGVAHIASANKESIKVAHVLNEMFGLAAIETHVEQDALAAETDRLFYDIANHFTHKPEYHRAWSATHGKGYAMGEAGPKTRAAKEAIEARKAAEAEAKAKRQAEREADKATRIRKTPMPKSEKARRLLAMALAIDFNMKDIL